jgi:P-type Ca2+ transporter type 2C
LTDTPAPRRDRLWHTLPADVVVAELGTDTSQGLSESEAGVRFAEYGSNELRPPEPRKPWKMFLAQFNDFMIFVLMGAVVLSAIEGQMIEAVAILAILLLNGVLGFVQEYQAERAMDALKEMAAPTATVIRGGVETTLPATALVPGDLVILESGDRIPADGRLVEAAALQVDEASLTGESHAVAKHVDALDDEHAALGDRRCMLYAGTSIAVGRALYVVTETGERTEMGHIADLLASTEDDKTPLQRELRVVGKRIAIAVLAIAAITFLVGAGRALLSAGVSLSEAIATQSVQELLATDLLVAISLAVAAIPEGLPAIVTVSLSLGVRLMAKRNAIVRRLHAVETLGSTTFICTDKTGTLTRNEMVVRRLVVGLDQADVLPDWGVQPMHLTPDEEDLDLLLQIAETCNDSRFTADDRLVGDPTETALVVAASHLREHRIRPPRLGEVPFDSDRKRMTTVNDLDDRRVAFMKGGPDVVLGLCTRARIRGRIIELTGELRDQIVATNEALASTGHRTLGFAMRDVAADEPVDETLEHDFVYVGILGMVDPPRPEVPDAIAACHRAGIHVAMVTGDHALTAAAIGNEIGLLEGKRVVSGSELEQMTDEQLAEVVDDIRIYARVSPEHKLRIVDALKSRGHVVAMTGDGVNDAPALKRADIGIAMGKIGTDVSREAADMVLADDNFATIVAAIERGRTVFTNIRKFILFLLSCNASEVLIIFTTSFVTTQPALLPLQLLWNNLVTDGMPALALGVDPPAKNVMDQPPRAADEGILTRRNQFQIVWQGALLTIGGLAVFIWGDYFAPGHHYELGQTMLFTTMVMSQLLHSFSFRSPTSTVFSLQTFKNKWLVLAFLGSFATQLAIIYIPALEKIFHTEPLDPEHWAVIFVAAFIPILIIDVTKIVLARRNPATEEPANA